MKVKSARRLACLVLVAFISALLASQAAAAESNAAKEAVIPGQYIVVFEDSVERTGVIAEAQTDTHDGELGPVFPLLNGYGAELPKGGAQALRQNPKVKYVVPDVKGEFAAQTVPTGVSRSFAMSSPVVDIDETDDVRVDADVAILDSGIDNIHPDLNVVERTDCFAAGTWEACQNGQGADEFGHGTHVSGIAGAIDNGFGTVGIAPGARLWGVRVGNTVPVLSAAISGVEWVTIRADKIEAVNMSFFFSGYQAALDEVIDKSMEAGVVYVAAAGNDDRKVENTSPPSFPDVITVSALGDYDGLPGGLVAEKNCLGGGSAWGKDDKLAAYSNWGSLVDIAAPGTCIYSTMPGGTYGFKVGTSMAAPYVTGAAAIFASKANPSSKKDVEAIRNILVGEGSLNWTDDSGDGAHEPLLDLRAPAPETLTLPATDLQTHSARLNAVVSAGGLASSYRFEYGPTTSYGLSAPTSAKSIGSGVGDLEVSETIAVKPETTYHYRVALTNSKGTFYGEDQTFKTPYWNVQPISNPSAEDGKASELRGVSCLSTEFCMAVGEYSKLISAGSYQSRPTAQRWDGEKWTVLSVPSSVGISAGQLESVSCTSSSACTAVGWNSISGKAPTPIVVRWNGAEWSTQSTPAPAGLKGAYELNGVTCMSASSCVAVGSYVSELNSGFPLPNEEKTLIETWNGTEWSIQASPNAEGKKFSRLSAISCSAANACTAVGKAKTERLSSDWVTLVERWNGSAWSIQASPNPVGTTESALEDVSCSSPTTCVAVGYTKGLAGFTMQWSGSAWQVGLSQLGNPLYGVSCLANGNCHAVGHASGRAWNGSEWSTEDLAAPPGGTGFKGRSVSCLPTMPCTAVGDYNGPRFNPGVQPLAEHLPVPQGTPSTAAARLTAEGYPAAIGSTSPYGTQYWQFKTAQQHCDAPQLQEGILAGPSAKQEAGAKEASCYDNYTGKQLKMNGCKFIYRPGAKTGATTFKGTVDIHCPTGQPLAFTGGGTIDCQVRVPGQYGLPATYENVGVGKERSVKVTVNATGLKHRQVSGTNCGGSIGSYENGSWSGSWKVQGSAPSGQIGIWVAQSEFGGLELPPAGIAISGSPPKLNAGTYPISIAGEQKEGGQHLLALGGAANIKCATAKLTASAPAATAQLTVAAEYGGCLAGTLPATVEMNGCTYTFNVLNQAPVGSTYAAHADIACPAGKAIEVVVKNGAAVKCTVTAGAQTTDAGGLSLTNEAGSSTIGLALSIKGIDYHQQAGEGLGKCNTLDKTDGTYTGSSALVGSY